MSPPPLHSRAAEEHGMSFLADAYIVPTSRMETVCRAADEGAGYDDALKRAATKHIEYEHQGAGYCVVSALTFLGDLGIDLLGVGGRHPDAQRLQARIEAGSALVLTRASRDELLPKLRATKIKVPDLVRHGSEMGGARGPDAAETMK